MRVLLVEDDLTAARGIALMLKSSGAVVDHTDTGEEALELTRHYEYDIVLLDLMLPDIEGYEVVRRMRLGPQRHPGADPVRPGASAGQGEGARHWAPTTSSPSRSTRPSCWRACRRSSGAARGSASRRCASAPLELNLDSREVTVDGKEVHLTGKEYAILELLVLRKGMVLTKEAFLNHLYGGMDEPEMKIIDVFICKLRKKLAQAGADNLIGTVWGRGYMMREPSIGAGARRDHAGCRGARRGDAGRGAGGRLDGPGAQRRLMRDGQGSASGPRRQGTAFAAYLANVPQRIVIPAKAGTGMRHRSPLSRR